MEDDKKLIVAKSNILVDAFYQLSLMEHRLVAYSISCIDRNDIPRKGNLLVKFLISDFVKPFSLKISEKKIYEAVERLYRREITLIDDGIELDGIPWLTRRYRNTDKGLVKIKFNEDIVPHLTGLKSRGNYTMYLLDMVSDFTCQHTFHVWEMLAKTRNMKNDIANIPIDYLRKKLGLEGKYKDFPDFNKRVIKPVFEDLNNCTKLNIDYELIKKGRSYTAIQVIFKEDKEALPPKKKKASSPAKLTKKYIDTHAKRGESYEQAAERLRREATDPVDSINDKAVSS